MATLPMRMTLSLSDTMLVVHAQDNLSILSLSFCFSITFDLRYHPAAFRST